MKTFGYVWLVLINLITVGVVLAIFGSLSEKFQTIVVSLLVLIYINIQAFAMKFAITTGEQLFFQAKQFSLIRQAPRGEIYDGDNDVGELDAEEITEAEKKFSTAKTKMVISDCFLVVINIIVLWNLFIAISSQ